MFSDRERAESTEHSPSIGVRDRYVPRGLTAAVETDENGVGLAVGRDDFQPWVIVTSDSDLRKNETVSGVRACVLVCARVYSTPNNSRSVCTTQ